MKQGKKKDKKTSALDKYIILSLTVIILYTIAHSIIFAITGQEAKVLDGLFFSTFSLEILFCFLIKRFKLHEEAGMILGKKKSNPEEFSDDDVG